MDFKNVKSLTIPEGVVKKITSNGVVLWTAQNEEPIWTWKEGDSLTDKTIAVPSDFDAKEGTVKFTLSARLFHATGKVKYTDTAYTRATLDIERDKKFTVEAKLTDNFAMVDITDNILLSNGFTFRYNKSDNNITVNYYGTYEPTEVTLWDVEFINPEPVGGLIAEWYVTNSSLTPGSIPYGYFTTGGSNKSLGTYAATVHTSTGDITTKYGLKLNSTGRLSYNITEPCKLTVVVFKMNNYPAALTANVDPVSTREIEEDNTVEFVFNVTESSFVMRDGVSECCPIIYAKLESL